MPNTLDSAPEITPPEVSVTPPETPTDTSAQLEKFREAIASSSLEENERTAITNNLDALRTRVHDAEAAGNTVETRRLLEEFQQQMDLLLAAKQIEETPLPEVATTPPSEGSAKVESLKDKVVSKAKEVAKDFQEGSPWTKAGYIAGGVVGFLAVRWLVRKMMGDGTNEGWIKKTGRWMAMLGGTIAGALGMHHLFKKGITSVLPDEIKDYIPDGVSDAVKNTPQAVVDMGRGALAAGGNVVSDAKDALSATSESLAQNWDPRNPESSLKVLIDSGAIILWNGTSFMAHVVGENLGKGIALNGLTMAKMAEMLATRSIDDDFFYMYAEGGASYLIGKKALNLVMQGKLNIPMTKKDGIVTILRIAGGPLDMVTDLLSHGSLAVRRGGLKAIKLRYVQKSLPMIPVRWAYESVYLRKIDSAQKLMQAVELWSERANELTTMRNFSYGGFDLFSETEVEKAERNLEAFRESIREAAKTVTLQSESPEILKEMKKNAHLKEKFNEKLQVLWNEHQQRLKNPSPAVKTDGTGPKLAEGTQGSGNIDADTPPSERKIAAGGESIADPNALPDEKPQLRIAPETLPDDVPEEAEKVINRVAQNADEAMEMRHGASALTKVGVGINTLFLLYEVTQVVQIWKEVGKLEAEGKMDATLKQAAETKRPIAFMHTEALAADVIAGGIGSVYVLSGRLALVATGVGGLALIALPLGLSIRAGMYNSIADFELQSGMKLSDRLNGNDEKITGAGKEQQLGTLGSHSLTMRLGVALSSATMEDLEQENAEARKEIVMSMVLEHLRETAPEDYDALLKKLGVNGVNGLMNEKITTTILLPKIGDAFVNRAKTKTSLTPDVEQALRAFNIRRGMFRSNYLSNEDLQEITYEASGLLGAWATMEGADDLVAMQQYATAKETEKKEHATAAMKEIFGERADAMMAMSTTELQRLCEKHARMMVNINYIEHSALQNIIKRRQQTPLAADVITLRERFDALNQFMHVHRHLLALKIEQKTKRAKSAWDVSPDEAFLKAGTYSVTDEFVAFWGNPHAGDEMFSMNAATIQKESERSQWYDQVLKDYNELMGQTRKAA